MVMQKAKNSDEREMKVKKGESYGQDYFSFFLQVFVHFPLLSGTTLTLVVVKILHLS